MVIENNLHKKAADTNKPGHAQDVEVVSSIYRTRGYKKSSKINTMTSRKNVKN